MFKNIFCKVLILGFSLSLIACSLESPYPEHVPHYVDQVPARAQIIARQTKNLSPQIVAIALNAYNKAQAMGYGNRHILTIIDYSKPSARNRFWVINLDTNQVLFKELVAHGIGSGMLYSSNFSDTIDSKASSLGMYITANQPYHGRHGYSLRLIGLDPGFNDNALKRAIVVHGAPYVCESFVQIHGRAGTSWGCPALNPDDVKKIINTIQGGTLIFAYGKDPRWLANSIFLH